jgi:predicted nuclease of predicted toxin-antitoxin system
MLSDRGIETIHWTAVGVANAQDIEIMSYARQNGYAVFTNDLDFSAILVSSRASRPSVIQIRAEDTRPEALIDRIADIFVRFSAAIEQGALITIDPQQDPSTHSPFYAFGKMGGSVAVPVSALSATP